MYSDSSDDEQEQPSLRFRDVSWPYLRLHEQEEETMRRAEQLTLHQMKEAGNESPEVTDYYKSYRVKRFFDTFEGFLRGSLDLSGRHLHRYESLIKKWAAFQGDFIALTKLANAYEYEDKNWRTGEVYIRTAYEVGDEDKWSEFAKKWKIPSEVDYNTLVNYVLKLKDVPTTPVIQKLCLLDLPSEILDYIFSVATIEQARLLSSTCKVLREIGRRFIFTSRKLTLEYPHALHSSLIKQEKPKEEKNAAIIAAVEVNAKRLLESAEFLLSRNDILACLDDLSLTDEATYELLECEIEDRLPSELYNAINDTLTRVLRRCQNLTTLRLAHLTITHDMLRAILSLPQLITLRLVSCCIPDGVVQLAMNGEISASSHVLNVELVAGARLDRNVHDSNVWNYIAFFSNLRTLSIMRLFENDMIAGNVIMQHSEVFSTLQKLWIGPTIYDVDILCLARWITLNAIDAPLQLTHLKLSTRYWLDDEPLMLLIHALRTAPLEVLVLDGIKQGSYALIDAIAQNCPHLRGLTMTRRENSRQECLKLATWPHASWEYAPHFAAFQRLEHFSWNFRFGFLNLDSTPLTLKYFEEGFITEEEMNVLINQHGSSARFKEDFFMDPEYVAYPFAAHCPTLKSFVIGTGDSMFDKRCSIERLPNGSYRVEMKKVGDAEDEWNLPDYVFHWPHVFPDKSEVRGSL